MPQLPDAAALGQRPSVQLGDLGAVSVRGVTGMEDAGAQVVAGIGQQLHAVSEDFRVAKEHQDTIIAEAAYNGLIEKSQQLESDPKTGFRNVQGYAAMGPQFVQDYNGKFTEASNAIAEGLSDPDQKLKFKQRAQIAAGKYRGALLQHQSHEMNAFIDNTEVNAIALSLHDIALNWGDDAAFDTNMTRMLGMIDARGVRKGFPAAETELKKAMTLDEAWRSRIQATMNADPLRAETMFKQHELELDPKSRITLGHQLKVAVIPVKAKLTADAILTAPEQEKLDTGMTVAGQPLINAVRWVESRNNDAAVSPKGAKGASQVMDSTNASPGFGVRPAADDSPAERNRVGQDYLAAMQARYGGNTTLALAAYNAGPGKVDEWLTTVGDPRTGAISDADWAAKLPFKETREYVPKVLGAYAQSGGGASASTISKRNTQAMLGAWEAQARLAAEKDYPGNPIAQDAYVHEVKGRVATIVQAQDGLQRQAQGVVLDAARGREGGRPPLTFGELTADPKVRQAMSLLDPGAYTGIAAVLTHNQKEANGDTVRGNYGLMVDLQSRLFLPDEDPQKIRSVTELLPYMANGKDRPGINTTQFDWLSKQAETARNPEGNAFLRNKKMFTDRARARMKEGMLGKILAETQPEVIGDASFQFDLAVEKRIDELRKDGKDARSVLFDPKSPEYVLRPGYVESFLPSAKEKVAAQAAEVKAGQRVASGEIKLAQVKDDAGYAALPSGTVFIDPKGARRVKP